MQQKSRTACEEAGWSFQLFVADAYGALRAHARGFVARFIKRYHHKLQPLDEPQGGRDIWCTISTAVISRPAQQLCQLSLIDNPLGLPPQALDLRSARSTSSTLPLLNLRDEHQGFKVLGVPMGSSVYVQKALEETTGKIQQFCERLVDLEHPQMGFILLRQCCGTLASSNG